MNLSVANLGSKRIAVRQAGPSAHMGLVIKIDAKKSFLGPFRNDPGALSRELHALSSPSIPSSRNPASLTVFWLALLAAIDNIAHIVFHLPPLHVPLQAPKRTIPHPSLIRRG